MEAEKESGVRDAINGLRVVLRSKQPQLVPVEEMVDAITVKNTSRSDLKIGAWVRVQSGMYKSDLAILEDLDPAGTKVVIKIVPRIDYQEYIKRCDLSSAVNTFSHLHIFLAGCFDPKYVF